VIYLPIIPACRTGRDYRLPITIPSTYVPARNIIFLSFALSYAEAIKAGAIFIGAHSQDYSGYPDCRPEFYRAFSKVIATGTKSGVEKRKIQIKTPLIRKTKAQIIRLGKSLGVPFALTWSCYRGGKRPCGICDSCYFRAKGFREAGLIDPLLSKSS
jgi:7-cyano-7-deazaguanine synthase